MDFLKEFCEICCNDENSTVQLNCKHKLCFECFKIAVLPKEKCPFCKQIVNQVFVENKILNILEFDKPVEQEFDFFQESNFEPLNDQFFDEDIRILLKKQNLANRYMMRTIRQTDSLFNLKWFIFDQISEQISNLSFTNSLDIFQEVQKQNNKINNLNVSLNLILINDWDQAQFKDYKDSYNLRNIEKQYQQFVVSNQAKKNKKRNKNQL